jgi:hypothetical protein
MKTKLLCGLWLGMLALAGSALGAPGTNAYDEAGNYTPATFVNGANLGTGFGAWDLWNKLAELGDSTAGGGGNLNSTNGYSFRFMGDGTNGWCNGKRNLSGALQSNDVLSFTFTYNWDGGGRGVDIFCSTGQFANLIHVSGGNSFSVNGAVISTEWSPGAVVAVDITQQASGIQVHLTRTTNGTENLNYTTNILNAEPANGFSLYCGGYSCLPVDNVNYAIFMNNIKVVGEPPKTLTFTGGTWNPSATGDYPFELTRVGAVGDELVLTSSNTNAVTVPAGTNFITGSNTVSFNATVVSLTSGDATIIASNAASGAWAEYTVKPVAPMLSFTDGTWNPAATGDYNFTVERTGAVGDELVLTSSNTNAVTVPAGTNFVTGSNTVSFNATVVSLTAGPATIVASNAASGAWAEYVVTPVAPMLSFTAGTWNPSALGDYTYTVERQGAVGDDLVLSSSAPGVLTVPPAMTFDTGVNALTFTGTVVSLTGGPATIVASNAASGAWAEYVVTPVAPSGQFLGPLSYANTNLTVSTPPGFVPATIFGADCARVDGDWVWQVMTNGVDYTVSGTTNVVIPTAAPAPRRRIIRIDLLPI